MSTSYLCGAAGRIRAGATALTKANIAGIKKWMFKDDGEEIDNSSFESPVDANGVVRAEYAPGCFISSTVDIEGIIDHTATTGTLYALSPQVPVLLDLIFDKSAPNKGFTVNAFMKSRNFGAILKEGQTFTATFRVTGVPTAIGLLT